ncbi:hypothetical protein GUJ93_ZPchr0001g32338 [Zizania palustris]|uniref:Uncharacterized protein n=1 Tax=Zizania palustris TaxID=103762 RepID=A0A8J5RMT9_ZIZPA|nr:hypothetical protein GUJ93_ZPchr0001g32338 [Zizania palustris]
MRDPLARKAGEHSELEVAIVVPELGASQTRKRDWVGLFVASECPELSCIDGENEDADRAKEASPDSNDSEGSSKDSGSDISDGNNSEESNEDPSVEGDARRGL